MNSFVSVVCFWVGEGALLASPPSHQKREAPEPKRTSKKEGNTYNKSFVSRHTAAARPVSKLGSSQPFDLVDRVQGSCGISNKWSCSMTNSHEYGSKLKPPPQVLVLVSSCQGRPLLVPVFDPHPHVSEVDPRPLCQS